MGLGKVVAANDACEQKIFLMLLKLIGNWFPAMCHCMQKNALPAVDAFNQGEFLVL